MSDFHSIMTGLAAPATFYFVRHGESEGNAAGIMQGHQEHPLTDLGREQARATGRWFAAAEASVGTVFASPLSRAFETAEIIASTAGLPAPEALPSAMELDTGRFTGLSFAEIQEQHPQEYREFVAGSWEVVPEAERTTSLAGRALQTWERMVAAANTLGSSPATVMTVTHGGMLQWIFKVTFGVTPERVAPWMPLVLASNCAVFEFTARPVRSTDRTGAELAWYYGQWSRVNFTPAAESSPGAIAREQFQGGDVTR